VNRPRRGPLILVGGEEWLPGNEPHDELFVRASRALDPAGSAFVIAAAAVRQDPDRAVAVARTWFAGHGLAMEELPLRTRRQASSTVVGERAGWGSGYYLCGGDPGLVVSILQGSAGWAGILAAWRRGAPLAGSSAGAMALGEWTLIRARMPGDARREPRPALTIVPGIAVVPHFDRFGHRWVPSARGALADATLLGIDERTAAVWEDGHWRVLGRGGVTLMGAGHERRFEAGEWIRGLPAPRR
jgi:cyanophycinase